MKKVKVVVLLFVALIILVSGTIDLDNLFNYENQAIPSYITKDNTPSSNTITDEGTTLGRVLFYDKKLSLNNTVACASCHQQAFAFSDTAKVSVGLNGTTGRHSMRLINSRFSDEARFFWDERALSLEEQTTMPIQDHIEMGFSGTEGDPNIDSLLTKLAAIDYYQTLFGLAYGDTIISEERIQLAIAQFVRSIQSFDAKFDVGRAQVNNNQADFPNYTDSENRGKTLFLEPPPAGGVGCGGCHRAPEFDIDPNSMNNGIIGVAGDAGSTDLTNTKAPTLRDIVNPDGTLNGPLMHDGSITSLEDLIEHYNLVPPNANIDRRLRGPGGNLQLTDTEKQDLINFLKTLTGTNVYIDERWSDPFDSDGNLTIMGGGVTTSTNDLEVKQNSFQIYPNPAANQFTISGNLASTQIEIINSAGQISEPILLNGNANDIDITTLPPGLYFIKIQNLNNHSFEIHKLIKK